MKKLIKIQSELKAPKNQYNNFGKYNYRNCEDILEAVKPLLEKYECSLIIMDSIKNEGDRYYVCATAIFSDGEKEVSVQAFAREPQSKKGMDESQITGASSSYARKYALNGLFLIDDTKDSDTPELKKESEEKSIEIVAKILKDAQKCATVDELTMLYDAYPEYQELLKSEFTKLKNKLNGKN